MIVQLNLLGNCRIQYGDSVVDNAPRKVWVLLEYLYINRDRFVNLDEISSVVWQGKRMMDPSNSIKVLVYELRNRLNALGKGVGKSLVINLGGAYRLSEAFEYQSDIEEFERASLQALDETIDVIQRDALMDHAISIYKGNVLLMDESCVWQRLLRDHYAALYETIISRRIERLCETGDQAKARRLCEKAYLTNPASDVLRSELEKQNRKITFSAVM
jgi:DNA-binding SARP family transcriptional activator